MLRRFFTQAYAQNVLWLTSERLLRMAIQFVVGVWLHNYLGEEQVGILGYVVAFLSFFQILPAFGSKGILIHEFVEAESEKKYFGVAVSLHALASAGAISLCLLAAYWFSGTASLFVFIAIASGSLLFYPLHVIEYYFQAKLKTHYVAIAYFVTYLISAVLKAVGIFNGYSLTYFVFVILAENVLLSLSFLLAYFHHTRRLHLPLAFDRQVALQLVKWSFPLLAASASVIFLMRIDQVMIQSLLGNQALGNYVVALKFSEVFYFLPPLLANLSSAGIVKAHRRSREAYYTLLQNYFNSTVWLGIGLSVVMTFAASPLIWQLYSGGFREAIPVLQIHMWAIVFVFMGMISDRWILQERLYSISLLRNGIGCVFNIALNTLWLPTMGIAGAAWATLLSYGTAYWFAHLVLKKSQRIFFMQCRAFAFPIRIILKFWA